MDSDLSQPNLNRLASLHPDHIDLALTPRQKGVEGNRVATTYLSHVGADQVLAYVLHRYRILHVAELGRMLEGGVSDLGGLLTLEGRGLGLLRFRERFVAPDTARPEPANPGFGRQAVGSTRGPRGPSGPIET